MAGQNPGVSNVNQFETYFQRADLDKDGRITGAEAVAFFQGSNLPKPVLAQIWTYADQNRAGFLGRQEFYNALKLVTVAQSKRDLTPDIVQAALYGPAAAKIPPPQINLSAIPSQQANPMTTASTPQMGATTTVSSQGFGFRGPGVPNASIPHQSVRPLQAAPVRPQGTGVLDFSRGGSVVGQASTMSTTTAPRPPQPIPAATPSPYVPTTSISNDWLGGNTGGAAVGSRSISPATSLAAPRPQSTVSLSSQPTATDSKSLVASGNGFASDSAFGGDAFAALSTTSRKEPFASTGSATGSPAFPTSASVLVSRGAQSLPKAGSLDSLQSALSLQSSGPPLQRTQSLGVGPQVSAHNTSPLSSSGSSVGVGSSAHDNAQFSWPKMKPSDIQKYTKVFMEVDADRDGRITGEQARNLFLSWRLPREVLKQVWDLSDQDNDSMLSLREFCFALYLMERFREGRTLPATLPRNVMLDETLMSMTGQPNANYGNAGWTPSPGFGQQQVMGARPMSPPAGGRPPVPVSAPNAESEVMSDQQMSRAPVLDDSFASQLENGEQKRVQEVAATGTKVDAPERVILDSREKIEFYRSKMQELVLYKSRCDNRLNEITERALADKREAETLSKKYEEKYKQVAEIASKLTIEEAKFRELQERKMELHQAIVAVERGGSADGILQVRADRIQSDLEELLKALTERCKKHNLDVKSSALIELPFGWQPGIQGEAAVWDEEWDKFEDEGFGSDLTINVNNASSSPNENQEKASQDGSLTPDSNVGDKTRNLMNGGARAPESESAYTHSEDELARSPHGSFVERAAPESPSQEFSDVFRSTEADTETHRSFDESTWGAFDNDDTDSVWGFNAVSSKGFDSDKHKDIFGSRSGESTIQKKSPFTFDDSVPSTPLSRYGNSPPRFSDFDSFSRFDSFSMQDSRRFSPQPEKFSRFDSINSSKDFGGPERLTRFDSINSTKDFGSDKLARFDSINSTKDFGKSSFYSFDDDPFGSTGPFKVSSDMKSKDKF